MKISLLTVSKNLLIGLQTFQNKYMIDFSAGAYKISDPIANMPINDTAMNALVTVEPLIERRMIVTNNTMAITVQKFSRKFLKTLPKPVLIGVLGLVGLELLQREMYQSSMLMPPIIQNIANITTENLETKIDILSSLSFELDPFFQYELDNLQTQPFEAIEKYIINNILPRVDKELSPILSSLIAKPGTVRKMTQTLKDIIKLNTKLLAGVDFQNGSKLMKSESKGKKLSLVDQLDVIGRNFEEVIYDWNRVVQEFGKIAKAESLSELMSQYASSTELLTNSWTLTYRNWIYPSTNRTNDTEKTLLENIDDIS